MTPCTPIETCAKLSMSNRKSHVYRAFPSVQSETSRRKKAGGSCPRNHGWQPWVGCVVCMHVECTHVNASRESPSRESLITCISDEVFYSTRAWSIVLDRKKIHMIQAQAISRTIVLDACIVHATSWGSNYLV